MGRESCCPPLKREFRIFQKVSVSIITAEEVGAEGDAQGLIEMLVDKDSTLGKRDSQMGRLDLKDETLEGNRIVLTDGTFLFDREDPIKINVGLDGDKSGSGLLGFDGEALVELADIGLLQEKISSLFGFDTVQTKFVRESALEGFIDAFSPSSCLRTISRDRPDAQLGQGPSYLG